MSSNRDSPMPNNPDTSSLTSDQFTQQRKQIATMQQQQPSTSSAGNLVALDRNNNYPEISGQAPFIDMTQLQLANTPGLQFQNLQATPNLLLTQSQQYPQQQQLQQQPPASMQGIDASQLAALGLASNPSTALAQLQQMILLKQLQQQQLQLQHNAAVAGMNGQQLQQLQQHYPSTNQQCAGSGSMMPTGADHAQLAAIAGISTATMTSVFDAAGSEFLTGIIGECRQSCKLQFPEILHRILSTPQFRDVISWLPHGRSWRVLKPKAFEERIIPLFFRHAKYTSFMRQVSQCRSGVSVVDTLL